MTATIGTIDVPVYAKYNGTEFNVGTLTIPIEATLSEDKP